MKKEMVRIGILCLMLVLASGFVSATACTSDANCSSLWGQCSSGFCNLTSHICQVRYNSSSDICRPAMGLCDIAEKCTGTSSNCPTDALSLSTTTCRAASGECDIAEKCTGTSVLCPSDVKKTNGVACSGGTCQNGACVKTCTPNCTGKQCGDDGCGGSCGICSAGYTCQNWTCVNNTPTCIPKCAGKYCGSNGCGGSCGTCSAGYTCIQDKYCAQTSEPEEPPVEESTCTDTDYGFSIFNVGTTSGIDATTGSQVQKTDTCKTSRILTEWHCSAGKVTSTQINCLDQSAKGCQAGRCTFKLDSRLRTLGPLSWIADFFKNLFG